MPDVREGRILVVIPQRDDEFTASVLEKLGHPVTMCNGPDSDAPCPLLHGEGCSLYDDAHGIVFSLDLGSPDHRAILREYERMARDEGKELPIRVVTPAGTDVPADILEAVRTWSAEPCVAELDGFAAEVEAVDRLA